MIPNHGGQAPLGGLGGGFNPLQPSFPQHTTAPAVAPAPAPAAQTARAPMMQQAPSSTQGGGAGGGYSAGGGTGLTMMPTPAFGQQYGQQPAPSASAAAPSYGGGGQAPAAAVTAQPYNPMLQPSFPNNGQPAQHVSARPTASSASMPSMPLPNNPLAPAFPNSGGQQAALPPVFYQDEPIAPPPKPGMGGGGGGHMDGGGGAPPMPQPGFPGQGDRMQHGGGAAAMHGGPPSAHLGSLSLTDTLKEVKAVPDHVQPCHPKFLSLAVNAVPQNRSLGLRSQLQMGVVLRPLANRPAGHPEIPVINFGSAGVIRCKPCRAYINPYVQFVDSGGRWRCNLCNNVNEVSASYYASLDSQGNRTDLAKRPELTMSTVEIVAPDEYTLRQPMPPTYVFIIDVSIHAIKTGMVKAVCDTLLNTLDQLPGGKRTRVAFITFDSTVHMYSLASKQSGPAMFVLPDLADVVMPTLPSSLLVTLHDSKKQVVQLLKSLPAMHTKTYDVETALGPALSAAHALANRIGGKFSVFLSSMPSIGPGRLVNREDSQLLGTEGEAKLLNATPTQGPSGFYTGMAAAFTRFQISVDLYVCPSQYCDLATLSQISQRTGGQVSYYPNYSPQHAEQLSAELTRALTRTQGWEAVVRIRASQGVRLHNYFGSFTLRGNDLLALPAVDCDKTFAVELVQQEGQLPTRTVSVQAALLYSTSFGERRIRVHTICVPTTADPLFLYKHTNVNALVNVVSKHAVSLARSASIRKAREYVHSKCVSILRAYRQNAMAKLHQQDKQQVSFPDNLLTLPLMTLGLLKNVVLRDGTTVRPDRRVATISDVLSMSMVQLETFLRPRMLPVHELLSGTAGLKDAATGAVTLPAEVSLSAQQLTTRSAFLIDDGVCFYLRLGQDIDPTWLRSVFGDSGATFAQVDCKKGMQLAPCEEKDVSSPNRRLRNIFAYLRAISSHYQRLVVCKQGDASEQLFFDRLIEDRSQSAMSLAEFNQHILRVSSGGTF